MSGIFGKHEPGYNISDNYELVQSVALFLCGHYGEYLDDVLYISKKGKQRTIKTECCPSITRMLTGDYRALYKFQSLAVTREKAELEYERQTDSRKKKCKRITSRLYHSPQMLINTLVKQIKLYDDKIIIQYNSPVKAGPDESRNFSFYEKQLKMPYVRQNKKDLQYRKFTIVLAI